MSDWIAQNPKAFMILFAVVLVFFLIGFIALKVISAQKKKKLVAGEDKVEIVFDRALRPARYMVTDAQADGYKIYSVNDALATIVEKSLFVSPGENTIQLECLGTTYASRRSSSTTSYGKRTVSVQVERGVQYTMVFDEKTEKFVFSKR